MLTKCASLRAAQSFAGCQHHTANVWCDRDSPECEQHDISRGSQNCELNVHRPHFKLMLRLETIQMHLKKFAFI